MSDLITKHCQSCEGGVEPLTAEQANELLAQVPKWALSEDGKWISRAFRFKNYYQTIAFVNAQAWIANQEDHHPDIEVGYSRCLIRFSTHAIDGLSENDFICAAKIDAIIANE